MSEVTETFKSQYFAGETAKIAISAPNAAGVSVVYGSSSLNLTQADGVWSGNIPTAALVGPVNWTAFVKDASGGVEAVGHGTFFVRCAGRSPLRDVVSKIDEAVRTWGTNPNRSIAVGEINITYKTLDELLAVRAQYVQQAEAQESGKVLTGGLRTVEVKF